jgi:glutamine amidotransferase PdxT
MFLEPDPDMHSQQIRIRIQESQVNANPYGSRSETIIETVIIKSLALQYNFKVTFMSYYFLQAENENIIVLLEVDDGQFVLLPETKPNQAQAVESDGA